jgi:hypothetical protein
MSQEVQAAASTKDRVRRLLDSLPDDCSIEDVQYHLYVLETLSRRTEMADRGDDFVSQDEAEARMNKWLTK